MSAENDYEISRVKITGKGSIQQLWNLLQGSHALATDDVVLMELRDSVDRITGALTYYLPYDPPDDDKLVVFPHASRKITSFSTESIIQNEDDKSTTEGAAAAASTSVAGTSQSESTIGKPEKEESSFSMIRKAVAQQLDLEINLVTDLLVSYLMFEYKGSVTSYDKFADSYLNFNSFLKELTKYYKRERTCLLLCTQTILSIVGNQSHQFFRIIQSFCSTIVFKKWCWGLLRSLVKAQDNNETMEILHCLILIMHKAPEETIPEFYTYYSSVAFDSIRNSDEIKMAEGAVMYTALIISGITDCCNQVLPVEYAASAKDFIRKNYNAMLINPYNYGSLFAAYDMFCKDDGDITVKLRHFSHSPMKTFKDMLRLIEYYGKGTLRDRNNLSYVVASGAFEAFQVLLGGFDTKHFGSKADAFAILANLLQHTLIAENFLCGTPYSLSLLYMDSTAVFPLDMPTTLHLWKSLCSSLTSEDSCETLVRGVAKLNTIAEYVEEEYTYYMRPIDDGKLRNIKERSVYGIDLEAGVIGVIKNIRGTACVVWEIPQSLEVSAIDILMWSIRPIAENLNEMILNGASRTEFLNFDYCATDVHAVVEFLVQVYKTTTEPMNDLRRLVHSVCIIMRSILLFTQSLQEKVRLIRDLMDLVEAVVGFTNDLEMVTYLYEFLPGSKRVSMLQELILGFEGVTTTRGEVTLSFLNLMYTFTANEKCWNQESHTLFDQGFGVWIQFVVENIIEKCRILKFSDEGIKNAICSKVLQIVLKIYTVETGAGNREFYKNYCADFLICAESFFVQILHTSENDLQESIIVPTDSNRLRPAVVSTALKLLLQMVHFNPPVLMKLDKFMEGWLVRTLGRHARHRLAVSIPTTATLLLKEVAASASFSLLGCFSSDEAALRDVIMQRLEFTTEDVNLKIAVLDYLTVLSQTQIALIQYFFADGDLDASILDLMQEGEDLAVPCLYFFRSMFRQRQPPSRSREDFWTNILLPVKSMKLAARPEIITATMHILTFEMYRNGTNDSSFTKELQDFLKGESFRNVVKISLSETNDATVKSLIAVKHFVTLILGRPESSKFISSDNLSSLLELVLETFWLANTSEDNRLCSVLAELAIIITTPEIITAKLLSGLVTQLGGAFRSHSLAVQLSMLCFVNKCYFHCTEIVEITDVENTFKILRGILQVAVKAMEEEGYLQLYQVLHVCATIVETIVQKHHMDLWGAAMKREFIPETLVLVASIGLSNQKSPNVVGSCIAALISLAEHPFGCNLVPVSDVVRGLYSNLYKLTETDSESWKDVFYLCLTMNSKLLGSLKHLYLDSALAFWAQNSVYLNQQMYLMTELTRVSVTPGENEKSYDDLKRLLTRGTFVLNDVVMMMPFIEKWQILQPPDVYKIIRGVFYTLQEASGVIQQPYLLQAILGKIKVVTLEAKPPAKFVGIVTKLWDICDLCMHILMKLKPQCEEIIEKSALIPTVVQMGFLCIRALNKSADKRSLFIGTSTSRIMSILEKSVSIVYSCAMPTLDDPTIDDKTLIAFRRDMCTDVSGLCDGIRRLATPRNEFLTILCSKMEAKLK